MIFPWSPFGAWEGTFRNLVRQLSGTSQLPLYELDLQNVSSASGKIRPFVNPRGFTRDPKCLPHGRNPDSLKFRAWKLAHAIKKADCANHVPSHILFVWSFGFLLEHATVFNWNPNDFRLEDGMSDFYADFSRTSLAGRVGQGMSFLFMEKQGYPFGERFFPPKPPKKGKSPGKFKIPDFRFEDGNGTWSLVESKGSFVSRRTDPNIKGVLNEALIQLGGWGYKKSFAVGTFLREKSDGRHEPSLLAFVDPEDDETPPSIPADAIRRGNYADWLYGMGFIDVASDLRFRRIRREQGSISFPKVRLGSEDYVFVILYSRPSPRSDDRLHFDWRELMEWEMRGHPWSSRGITFGIMGIKLSTMHRISESLRSGQEEPMVRLEIAREGPEPEWPVFLENDVKVDGSIFLDGTLLGELTIPRGRFPRLGVEEILL